MNDTQRLAAIHARTLLRAAERRASADRYRLTAQIERAEMAEDEAAEELANANALRDLLATLPDVAIPDDRQLSLLSLGSNT